MSSRDLGRIGVTGAGGYLGARVVRRFVQGGFDVVGVQRGGRDACAVVRRGDLVDAAFAERALGDCDTIVHCAARSSDHGSMDEFWQSNVVATERVVHAASSGGRRPLLVHVSSTDVYGYPADPALAKVPRSTGLPYNATKVAAEHRIDRFARSGGSAVVLRPSTIYGAGRGAVLESAIKALRTHQYVHVDRGRHAAGLVHVEDVVDVIEAAARGRTPDGPHDVCGPEEVSWRSFVEAVGLANDLRVTRLSVPFGLAYRVAGLAERFGLAEGGGFTRHAVLLLGRSQQFDSTSLGADRPHRRFLEHIHELTWSPKPAAVPTGERGQP